MDDWKPSEGKHPAPAPPDLSAVDAAQVVWLLNNVEYIQALEEGHSQQAPAGMLRVSLAAAELEIEALLLQMS